MEDKKNFNTDMDGIGEENKKLVDKFLTIKESPDKDKQKLHFEKMLEAFRKAEAEDNTDIQELSDDELDFLAAAGEGSPSHVKCPICGIILPDYLLEDHLDSTHR